MEKIKDIKDIVIVPDNSLEVLIVMVIITSIIIAYLIYKRITKIKIEKPLSDKEQACLKLKELDFKDIKTTIYEFERNISYFLKDKNKNLYREILKINKEFKYKLNTSDIEKPHQEMIEKIIKDIKC